MAFNEIEQKRVEKMTAAFVDSLRPAAHLRPKLDIDFRIENQSILIFEIRPTFDDPGEKHEIGVAKTTYVRKTDHWKVYWMRHDMKWHPYPPMPIAESQKAFLDEVSADPNACFRG